MSWKEDYERAAEQERQSYEAMSVEDLLRLIEQGQFGQYNTIWTSLTDQATPEEAAWTLFDVLQQDRLDYLIRCNCAEALLELMGREDVMEILDEAVNLSRGTPADRLPFLASMQQELTEQIGIKAG